MHTIRLRSGWVVTESHPGTSRHTRRFGRPTNLEPSETVWLTIRDFLDSGTVSLNGHPAGSIDPSDSGFSTEIRSLLLERNLLVLDIRASADRVIGDVCLEIRKDPITLAPATSEDYNFTHKLTRSNMETYVVKYWGGWNESVFRTNFERTENLVLRLGIERVGFVRLESAGEVLVIEDVQILPAYQNRGLGGWMLDQVCEAAINRGLPAVRLRCFKDNPARRLYARYGFRLVEDTDIAEWWEMAVAVRPAEPHNAS